MFRLKCPDGQVGKSRCPDEEVALKEATQVNLYLSSISPTVILIFGEYSPFSMAISVDFIQRLATSRLVKVLVTGA